MVLQDAVAANSIKGMDNHQKVAAANLVLHTSDRLKFHYDCLR
jgi:hypothetical protein